MAFFNCSALTYGLAPHRTQDPGKPHRLLLPATLLQVRGGQTVSLSSGAKARCAHCNHSLQPDWACAVTHSRTLPICGSASGSCRTLGATHIRLPQVRQNTPSFLTARPSAAGLGVLAVQPTVGVIGALANCGHFLGSFVNHACRCHTGHVLDVFGRQHHCSTTLSEQRVQACTQPSGF